ncbi:glycogen-binding domain-containing protein [uncultured Treponema sp.]|uniref:glycogen-binding domain-containing protein n=1 Tax=uncultured Treponema sp. TaxID=162155 RepID=UPI0025FB5C3B|nr:glycogen-binding domain-containing protein [uncultured Treponema sp.]
MKKLLSFISVLAVCSALFADITAKKLDDGSVEATFFYGNPRATEVVIAGDFTNWQEGAIPMEKGEKGFTLTKVFPKGTTVKYKFIVDGSWTTDLKAPDFVDDGFGGKNSMGELDTLVGGGNDSNAKRANIKFLTWTMLGSQAKFLTQGASDATKKGMDLDEVTVGAKSYAKFAGNITPEMPVYVELAVAETELDDALHPDSKDSPISLYKKAADGTVTKSFRQSASGLLSNPLSWFGKSTDNSNSTAQGPGTNPYLGHLKFGFETPWVNYSTGFNYAKQDKRAKILWTTIDGNWDAGYQHVGGFASFSTGIKAQELLADKGIKLDAGFVPNKSADRKGTKYGYIGWLGSEFEDLGLTVDFQSNGMFDGDVMFEDSVERDFVFGLKEKLNLADAGSITFAAQGLMATHQKTSDDLGNAIADYMGYSTDVFYRSGDNSINNMAAEAKLIYDAAEQAWGVTVDYRLRGAEASMLFLRENHDDGTFDLSETLGVLNSQNIGLSAYANLMEDALYLALDANAALPLKHLEGDSDVVTGWSKEAVWNNGKGWYASRCGSEMMPLFGIKSGAEFKINPTAAYYLTDDISITLDAGFKYDAYKYDGDDDGEMNKYAASDSAFLFKNAGITLEYSDVSDVIKNLNLYYGLDNSNDTRMFNTLVASATLPMDFKVSAAFGLKTVKSTDAADGYNKDLNNMLGFALGVSKQIKRIKSPILYAQFVYNMDPYKKFGDGQDQLALNGANVSDRWDKQLGGIDAVDYYDGYAAIRGGIRWEF